MFGKKKATARLSRVRITFLEGSFPRDHIPAPIEVLLNEGETFCSFFGRHEIRRPDGQVRRSIDLVAGFTTDVEFFYV